MNRVLALVVLLLLGLGCASSTMSRQAIATIEGVVYTAEGAPLPGVNVTLTGPGGHPTIITVTDENGEYIVGRIQPGAYDVTTELQGFVTVRQRVQVTTDGGAPVVTRLKFAEPLSARLFSST